VDYRNTDSGRPVRISDAVPTARRSLELSFGNGRVDRLSEGRYRLQLEPRVAYGILPRTEISLRSPIYFNERAYAPRSGVGGIGVGAESQLKLETVGGPAIAVGGELFIPTGPEALPPTYSARALLTRTFPFGRLHFNAGVGNFAVRTAPDGGQIIPPIHGACDVARTSENRDLRLLCMPSSSALQQQESDSMGTRKYARWIMGMAADKTFPLRSLMLVGDVFAQKYESIGRPIDWTAEVGFRSQLTHTIVLDAAIGRLFTGESRASFVMIGTTLSCPFTL
jgi:hypothetical protein